MGGYPELVKGSSFYTGLVITCIKLLLSEMCVLLAGKGLAKLKRIEQARLNLDLVKGIKPDIKVNDLLNR